MLCVQGSIWIGHVMDIAGTNTITKEPDLQKTSSDLG